MILYLDCEFEYEDQNLLSLALVPEDYKSPGDCFYWRIHNDHLPIDIETDEWVRNNVIPKFDETPDILLGRFTRLKSQLEEYICQYESVHIVADWPDDISYFCKTMLTGPGLRIDSPPITFEVVREDAYPSNMVSEELRHNAFWDALALKYKMDEVKQKTINK